MKKKYLIVNADDFGISTGVNKGILKAHLEGILTSTSLMPNGPCVSEAISIAKKHPSLGVGVHINVIEGKPISNANNIPSLIDNNGNFMGIKTFLLNLYKGKIKDSELLNEIKNQISTVYDSNLKITHIDSHKHIHAFPKIRESFAYCGKYFGIKAMRLPIQKRFFKYNAPIKVKIFQYLSATFIHIHAIKLKKFEKEGIFRFPDNFIGIYETGYLKDTLTNIILTLKHGITEIMTHPGYPDTKLINWGTRLLQTRKEELKALTDKNMKTIIENKGIHLITYDRLYKNNTSQLAEESIKKIKT